MGYKVKLEVFEGPLDLLLYLIKKNEIDICDIPISEITEQYLEYLELMRLLDLDIAGEFLVMAATLMHIKSRILLPLEEREKLEEEEEESDPREELVKKLLEYQKFKEAATRLEVLEANRRELFSRVIDEDVWVKDEEGPFFEANLFDLISAFSKVLTAIPRQTFQEIIVDEFSVEEKIGQILDHLKIHPKTYFKKLFEHITKRLEVVCTFLALLELIRMKEIIVRQPKLFDEILVIKVEKN